jgi:hypothetical protein
VKILKMDILMIMEARYKNNMYELNNQDREDVKTIAEEVQNMVIKFDLNYDKSAVAELLYEIDMSMRAILEIINGPIGTVERMI